MGEKAIKDSFLPTHLGKSKINQWKLTELVWFKINQILNDLSERISENTRRVVDEQNAYHDLFDSYGRKPVDNLYINMLKDSQKGDLIEQIYKSYEEGKSIDEYIGDLGKLTANQQYRIFLNKCEQFIGKMLEEPPIWDNEWQKNSTVFIKEFQTKISSLKKGS